jgi:uncharacterized YigZ family protein
MTDTYLTIAAPSTGEFKDRGSKFLGYAFPILTEPDWQQRMEEVRKEHPKARHHCFAYRLGLDGNNYRANDDGEPSGTAGRPILGQIDSYGLTNVFLVVVRYFGGTLLGASGLINAYKTCANHTLSQAVVEAKLLEDIFKLTFDYAIMGDLMNALKKLGLEILDRNFGETASLQIAVRLSEREKTLTCLKAFTGKITMEEAAVTPCIPGLQVELLGPR